MLVRPFVALMEEACLELLLGCGFFRARAADPLPTFDKVLFGLVWAITSASADVELDAELGEEATLGQKLRLGEAVERALRSMRCPAPLQAHQIQGLDFPALFPVVQWLVKQVLAAREEFGDARRGFALQHYAARGYAPLDAHASAAPQRLASRAALEDLPVTSRLAAFLTKNLFTPLLDELRIVENLPSLGLRPMMRGEFEIVLAFHAGAMFASLRRHLDNLPAPQDTEAFMRLYIETFIAGARHGMRQLHAAGAAGPMTAEAKTP